jgi:hypothetical protein
MWHDRRMKAQQLYAAVGPSVIVTAQHIDADPGQKDIVFCTDQQILMNCCRKAGKSTAFSPKALHSALYTPGSLSCFASVESGSLLRSG